MDWFLYDNGLRHERVKEDNMGISIYKTEPANCGSSDQSSNLQGVDFGTRSQVNNLVARNVPITIENAVNIGQYYCL